MTTVEWIIGVVLVLALLAFALTKFGWAIRTQPQGRWRARPRRRNGPPKP